MLLLLLTNDVERERLSFNGVGIFGFARVVAFVFLADAFEDEEEAVSVVALRVHSAKHNNNGESMEMPIDKNES